MRNYLLLVTLFASSAQACPELNGLHTNCRQSDGSITKVRIVQSNRNSVTRYKIDWNGKRSQIHDTDGVTREIPVFDTGMVLKKTASCEGELFKNTAVMVDASGTVKLDVTEEYTLMNGKLHFRALDEKGVYNEIVCR